MKKNNVVGGLIFIFLAICIVSGAIRIIFTIPWFKILCTLFFGAGVLKGFVKRDFFTCVMSACMLAWIYEDFLGISDIAPFPLFLAGIFLAIGLGMIFKKKQKYISFEEIEDNAWKKQDASYSYTENYADGNITIENNFSSTSQYVNTRSFYKAKLDNNFGAMNIYFQNVIMVGKSADIVVENNFGRMNIYFPSFWRIHMNREVSFGNIVVYGAPNSDMAAPVVNIHAESNFGDINIYFE